MVLQHVTQLFFRQLGTLLICNTKPPKSERADKATYYAGLKYAF